MTNNELYEFLHKNINVINDHIMTQFMYSGYEYEFRLLVTCDHKFNDNHRYPYAFGYERKIGFIEYVYFSNNLEIYSHIKFVNIRNIIKFVKRLYTTQQILK